MKELEPIQLSLFADETASASSEIATEVRAARLWFDGGTFPSNPGHGGGGAVLEIDGKEHTFSEYLGGRVTNNRAEYGGLLLGLRKALEMGVTHLKVFGDSQLVIYQMIGTYSCGNEGLIPLWREARSLATRFVSCEFEWIRRERNIKADEAARGGILTAILRSPEAHLRRAGR